MTLFHDLALLGERAHLAPQPAQLLTFVGGQALSAALIDVDLARPIAHRLRRLAELSRELRDRLAASLSSATALTAESIGYGLA